MPQASEVERQAKQWVNHFTSLKGKCDGYAPERVTPYMHIMGLHLKKVITNHGNLYQFSFQGMQCGMYMYNMLTLTIRCGEKE